MLRKRNHHKEKFYTRSRITWILWRQKRHKTWPLRNGFEDWERFNFTWFSFWPRLILPSSLFSITSRTRSLCWSMPITCCAISLPSSATLRRSRLIIKKRYHLHFNNSTMKVSRKLLKISNDYVSFNGIKTFTVTNCRLLRHCIYAPEVFPVTLFCHVLFTAYIYYMLYNENCELRRKFEFCQVTKLYFFPKLRKCN